MTGQIQNANVIQIFGQLKNSVSQMRPQEEKLEDLETVLKELQSLSKCLEEKLEARKKELMNEKLKKKYGIVTPFL